MQIACDNCGAVVPAENLSLENMVAKCAACAAVFPIQVGGGAPRPAAPPRAADVAPPRGYRIDESGPDLVATKRWANPASLVLVGIFAVLWNGVTWSLYFFVATEPIWHWVLLPFQIVGLLTVYLLLGVLVNATTIRVGRDRLSVAVGPLPFRGGVELDAGAIEQLFVTEQGKRGTATGSELAQSHRVYYRLEAKLRDGRRAVVLRAVAEAAEARWFERAIERRLGIVDRPEPGAV